MEDDEISDEKLLVYWSDKKCGKICEQVWYVLENKE